MENQTEIYAFSDTGTVVKAAKMLQECLGNARIEENPKQIEREAPVYVLGTNVHFGKPNKRFRRFLKREEETLKRAHVFIYVSAARNEVQTEYLERVRALAPYAEGVVFVWGELNLTGSRLQKFFINCLIEGRRDDRLPKPRLLEKELRALGERVKDASSVKKF